MKTALHLSFESLHFVGIFGSGMSAIAQYLSSNGVRVSGSDRLVDSPHSATVKQHLLSAGCSVFPQDGSGICKHIDAICVSTAIEEHNPDIVAARRLGIPVLHRSDVLAAIVKTKKCIAVAGTSGKSTVTAMIFELLTACKKSPSLISGAPLRSLQQMGMLGNAFCGKSELLVVEADESDGTIVKYEPYASITLNISKDHKPEEDVLKMFLQLSKQSKWTAVNADEPKLNNIEAMTTFGFGDSAQFKGIKTKMETLSSTITVGKTSYMLPIPGEYNASNLLAALCICHHFGCDESTLVNAVANYKGVERRFEIHHTTSGVIVIDDFAHNPEKIRAAVNAAKNMSGRIIAVYQPHGFAPTRFLKNEYAKTFGEIFSSTDILCLLPVYYAGGTAIKDISSQEIIELTGNTAFHAVAVENRDEALKLISKNAKKNDCILLMGARDPSLSLFKEQIIKHLS